MKKYIFLILILAASYKICVANETVPPKSEILELKQQLNSINEKYEYILKNYEIQNNTIQYVATILGVLLAIVIIYFGWKAQKVESEYETAKKDREKFNQVYETLFNEMNNKRELLKNLEEEIKILKDEINDEREKISKLVESLVLEQTESYLKGNVKDIIENNMQMLTEKDKYDSRINDLSNHLKLLENIQYESNPQIIYKKIDLLFNSDNYNEVIKIIESLIHSEQFNKDYLFKYAYSLYEVGEHNKSFEIYVKFLEYDPKNSSAMHNIAMIYKERDDIEKSISLYQEVLEINCNLKTFINLVECYKDVKTIISLYKKYWPSLSENKNFLKRYKDFVEENFCIEELNLFTKDIFENDNTSKNYLNYLEAVVISRNDFIFNELLEMKNTYNFNTKERIMFNFLVALNKALKNENTKVELKNINLLLESNSSLVLNWNFNLINKTIIHIPEPSTKLDFEKIIKSIEETKQKNNDA